MLASAMPRGDLTLRAVVTGGVIGVVFCCGNLYLGLKTGLWDPGWIASALLSFVVLAPLARVSGRAFTPAENLLAVTVASSTAAMPSVMGLLGAIPALEAIAPRVSVVSLVAWAIAVGALGLWLALPLREPLVEREDMPFPSGRATAEAIAAAHAQAGEARRRARALLLASAGAAIWAVVRDALHLIPAAFMATPTIGVNLSPMLLGGGALIGPRVALELGAGAVLAWLVLGPAVRPTVDEMSAWLLWPGVAAMVVAGVIAFAFEWRSLASFARDLGSLGRARTLGLGALAALAVVVVASLALGAPPLLGVAGVVVAVLCTGVFVRAFAQTDVGHYGAVGQLAQAVLGTVAGRQSASIVGGAISAGSAPQSVGLMVCFKVGSIVGGRPATIAVAHAIGIVLGALVSAPAYDALRRTSGVLTPDLPVPFAAPWSALAAVAERGLAALPPGATTAAAIAGGVALLLALGGRRWKILPAPLVMGLGFLVPLPLTLTMVAGALAAWATRRDGVPVAAGFIVGESVAGIAIALLIVAGLLS